MAEDFAEMVFMQHDRFDIYVSDARQSQGLKNCKRLKYYS